MEEYNDFCESRASDYESELEYDIDDLSEKYTIGQWNEIIRLGIIWNDCGCGYWMKDDIISNDEVFSTPQPLDATHVVWYSK